jgi:hypothetical protein
MANRPKILAKMRTTFYIDADLHRKLNIAVVSMTPKRSMSEVVEALIQHFLDGGQPGLEKALPVKSSGQVKVN